MKRTFAVKWLYSLIIIALFQGRNYWGDNKDRGIQ